MGVVYLLGDWEKEGYFKIGVTRGDVDKRIKKLQTGNGGEIYLVNKFECEDIFLVEKMLHIRFGHKKIINEWFELNNEDVVKFRETCEDIIETIKSLENNIYFKKKSNGSTNKEKWNISKATFKDG